MSDVGPSLGLVCFYTRFVTLFASFVTLRLLILSVFLLKSNSLSFYKHGQSSFMLDVARTNYVTNTNK